MSWFKKKDTAGKENTPPIVEDIAAIIGSNRSFAMAEAHKRLRTNVFFSFADKSDCRVIGITSAMSHEGKSTTSINLAYDILEAGKKVLLIDADMRLSRIAKILDISRSPGLSNLLVGENNGENLVQHSVMLNDLAIISCGEVPPNPTELLSSKRMQLLLDTLKKAYEYIIIDLPPISAVSDALIVSKLTDGMIVVVRQDHVDKNLLDDTVRQLKFNDANIIGFVMTCAQSESRYYKGKYKRYYGKKYGYGYGYGYYARHSKKEEK